MQIKLVILGSLLAFCLIVGAKADSLSTKTTNESAVSDTDDIPFYLRGLNPKPKASIGDKGVDTNNVPEKKNSTDEKSKNQTEVTTSGPWIVLGSNSDENGKKPLYMRFGP